MCLLSLFLLLDMGVFVEPCFADSYDCICFMLFFFASTDGPVVYMFIFVFAVRHPVFVWLCLLTFMFFTFMGLFVYRDVSLYTAVFVATGAVFI